MGSRAELELAMYWLLQKEQAHWRPERLCETEEQTTWSMEDSEGG
jgi:hypothetical protein